MFATAGVLLPRGATPHSAAPTWRKRSGAVSARARAKRARGNAQKRDGTEEKRGFRFQGRQGQDGNHLAGFSPEWHRSGLDERTTARRRARRACAVAIIIQKKTTRFKHLRAFCPLQNGEDFFKMRSQLHAPARRDKPLQDKRISHRTKASGPGR